jgi:hypothetical protein
MQLDHILWAAPDLDEGAAMIAALTGVTPARGGAHPGFGTRNCLLGLDAGRYFEVIAPDLAQRLDGTRGAQITAMPHPALLSFAVRAGDLAALRAAAEACGVVCEGPWAMTRTRPDGVSLAWSILDLRHPTLDALVPFAIDWGSTPHPAASAPTGCRLKDFVALHPEPAEVAAIYAGIGVALQVKRGARAGFLAVLDSPKGEVVLTSLDRARRRRAWRTRHDSNVRPSPSEGDALSS